MQKNITSATTYLNEPCGRCGSKRRVAKTWKETVPTLTGTTIVEYSQTVCTNDACQAAFDVQLLAEAKKREAMRLKKEANNAERKANSLRQAAETRKNKLRK